MELTKENVALLAACGVLLGTVISNVMTYLIHNSKQKNEWIKDNKRKRIEKAEELYRNLVIWKKSVFSTHNDWVLLVRGRLSLDQTLDKVIENNIKNPEYSKINELTSILAGIYFPDIGAEIKEAQKELMPANDIYFGITRGIIPKDKEEAVNTILNAGRNFDSYVDSILEVLSCKILEMMGK
ncbi:TPA: hypothetical protein MYP60_002492 [Citrobacter farmeri]|nr:hypothetical protein [Pluralibacter sp. S54_ASV_43]HAT3757149.1 hypothetical protein [Citrobacter amalonaticus]HCB1598804.1 hypothetical protein [Citrobacter farmeri]HCB1654467.1 hypothetical protein [Citrobacter farmeri]HCB1661100.1 hypothetical protein [Citrobacter farmeri]